MAGVEANVHFFASRFEVGRDMSVIIHAVLCDNNATLCAFLDFIFCVLS